MISVIQHLPIHFYQLLRHEVIARPKVDDALAAIYFYDISFLNVTKAKSIQACDQRI